MEGVALGDRGPRGLEEGLRLVEATDERERADDADHMDARIGLEELLIPDLQMLLIGALGDLETVGRTAVPHEDRRRRDGRLDARPHGVGRQRRPRELDAPRGSPSIITIVAR